MVLAWAVGLTSYVVFRDEVLAGLAARHRNAAAAYEDRIVDLKTELEKTRTRRLVEHEQLERRIDGLAKRQAAIESRQQLITSMADRPVPAADRVEAPAAAPKPASDVVVLRPAADRLARLESRPVAGPSRSTDHADTDGRLATLHGALDRTELAQATVLNRIEERVEQRVRRLRAALDDLGLDASRLTREPAMGGPFIPVAVDGTFEAQVARVAATVGDLRRLEHATDVVPLRRPIRGEAEVTSGFGTRLDPFLRRPAHHAGIDFRADTGTVVRATAAGVVKEAGWQGGFGNMVEIDHGNGLSTVFAHLSAIEVAAGQAVTSGQAVGRLGSTGRSTGPHLHYETRLGGEAVDPMRFLRAGVRLGFPVPE